MNVSLPYRVHIILDASFGERLTALPAGEPVWITSSQTNGQVAKRLQHERRSTHPDSITLFSPLYGPVDDEAFLEVLNSVDLHHGEHSAGPKYSMLEVVGCSVSEGIRSSLTHFGFSISAEFPEGFSARRMRAQKVQ